jgi:hypothetical protein
LNFSRNSIVAFFAISNPSTRTRGCIPVYDRRICIHVYTIWYIMGWNLNFHIRHVQKYSNITNMRNYESWKNIKLHKSLEIQHNRILKWFNMLPVLGIYNKIFNQDCEGSMHVMYNLAAGSMHVMSRY